MTKKILGKIKSKCYKFDLIAEEVNFYTLKVYSTKYLFDTWLIKVEDGRVNLYHNSKKYNNIHLFCFFVNYSNMSGGFLCNITTLLRHNSGELLIFPLPSTM